MSDQPDNLILVLLRRMDEKLDRLGDDMHDIKVRTTNVESGVAALNRRMDRFEDRLERIERRLDIVEA